MGSVRRDFLKLAGGLSAGLAFTPVPWKVLDDVSIWSQNWSWIPRPLRGEISTSFTNCTLCPAACGVRAKCIAGQPYQLTGISGHPVGRPTLCPAGLAAHQLPYATARVNSAAALGRQTSPEEALTIAARKVSAARSVVILDGHPGRCASAMYRRTGWTYALAPGCRGSMAAYGRLTGIAAGVDCERVQTIVSFGAPVLHGWQTPGSLLGRRKEFRLIQIEPEQSRTAAFADEWIPMAEDAAAPELVRAVRGESADARLAETARALMAGGAAAVLGNSPESAELNVLLGERAALVQRGPADDSPELTELPDGGAEVLIADVATALPAEMVRRKLVRGGTLICLSAYASDLKDCADIVIPAPAWQESREDVPGPVDAPAASFAIAGPLLPARTETMAPAEVVAKLSGNGFTLDDAINARIAAIHKAARGSLFRYGEGTSTPVKNLKADEFAAALQEGACWVDERRAPKAVAARAPGARPFRTTAFHGVAPVPMLELLRRA